MKIYLDLIFLLNFFYDFLILLTVGMTLKRKVPLKRYFLASIIGMISILIMFIPLSNLLLLIIKILTSIIIVISNFGFVSYKYTLNNLFYFYMVSIILAGFLNLLNNTFSLENKGLIFYNNGFNYHIVLLILISPVILICYYQSAKKFQKEYNKYYHILIVFDKYKYDMLAMYDSANSLKDPISGKSVIIVSQSLIKNLEKIRSPVYVPYNTILGSSIMPCFKPSYILINNQKIYNYLIGVANYNFKDGIKALLNNKLKEDGYV